mmetsp:Transcript_22624/g.59098  ORF Transcript_22624/g.59098 Transcript_22624/m.59098 type:complete len:117 (+) Transcript_22624:2154-2504(+)
MRCARADSSVSDRPSASSGMSADTQVEHKQPCQNVKPSTTASGMRRIPVQIVYDQAVRPQLVAELPDGPRQWSKWVVNSSCCRCERRNASTVARRASVHPSQTVNDVPTDALVAEQ